MDSIRTTHTTGPQLTIDCPACGGKRVTASSYEREESYRLLHFIPLFTLRNTFLKCEACSRELTSSVRLSDIETTSQKDLEKALSVRESFVGQAVAIFGLLLCWAPFVGLGLGLLGMVLNLRSAKWPKTLSQITTVIGVVVLLLMGLLGLVASFMK